MHLACGSPDAALCYPAVAAAAVLLLAAADRHRVCVPADAICCYGLFIASDSSVFFLFIQTRFSFNVSYPLAVLSHVQRRFTYTWYYISYILDNCGHSRSQGGRQPAAAKPPFYIV